MAVKCGTCVPAAFTEVQTGCITIKAVKPTVIILTFNCADTLPATLAQARRVADEIYIVDSFSKDETLKIAEEAGAHIHQHAFENYGAQRNWAIDSLPISGAWQLHLDADEWMSDELVEAILALPDDPPQSGFFLARYLRFLGRVLRHGSLSPTWHMRLFRTGVGRCEDRKYDQHFYVKQGATAQLGGHMVDDIRMSLSDWTVRHNRWSDGEVSETLSSRTAAEVRVEGNLSGNPVEKKRYWREKYGELPLFVRPFALFFYQYFFRLGILDGMEGFIFWVLQSFWFRFLIDAKLYEAKLTDETKHAGVALRS